MTRTTKSFRRGRFLIGTVGAAALMLTGCSSTSPETSAPDKTGSDSGFAVTLHNAFGDVTIPAKPERVVALGYADLALATALGADVVGGPQSFSSVVETGKDKNLPYTEPVQGDITWMNPRSINVEQVASLQPDVILATAAFTLDEAVYRQLSQIAPVVTYEQGLYADTSAESAHRVGQALGEDKGAQELIDKADAAVAKIKSEVPNLNGGTFLYGQAREGVAVMLVEKENAIARFMQSLGLTALPAVADLDNQGSVPGSVDVSFEQVSMFNDAGVLFMTFQSDALQNAFETNPLVESVPIMKSRYVPLGLGAATALQDPNVVSVPWLLDQLRPGLELIPAK